MQPLSIVAGRCHTLDFEFNLFDSAILSSPHDAAIPVIAGTGFKIICPCPLRGLIARENTGEGREARQIETKSLALGLLDLTAVNDNQRLARTKLRCGAVEACKAAGICSDVPALKKRL